MTSITDARRRLDKTLSSSALSDTAILNNLVRKQLLKTSSEKLATDEVVEKRSKQLLKLLDALRSAKGERSTKIVDGEWKVKSLSPFVNISSASEGLFSIRDSLEVATYDTGGYVKDNQLHVEFINNTVRSLLYYRLRSSQPITPFSQEHT